MIPKKPSITATAVRQATALALATTAAKKAITTPLATATATTRRSRKIHQEILWLILEGMEEHGPEVRVEKKGVSNPPIEFMCNNNESLMIFVFSLFSFFNNGTRFTIHQSEIKKKKNCIIIIIREPGKYMHIK